MAAFISDEASDYFSSDNELMSSYEHQERDVMMMPPVSLFIGEELWTADLARLIKEHIQAQPGMSFA